MSDQYFRGAMSHAREVFSKLDAHLTDEGMMRPGYGAREREAIGFVVEEAAKMGCSAWQDRAGNVTCVYEGKDPAKPAFVVGSHLDSVPSGGRYDGPVGVVAGLTAMHAIHQGDIRPEQPLVLSILRAEESPWFSQAMIGSQLALGLGKAEWLDRKRADADKTLAEFMRDEGLDPEELRRLIEDEKPVIPKDRLGCFIETHIEQAPTLLRSGHALGLVTAVRGTLRFPKMMTIFGEAAHTGSTPQEDRKDAQLAGAAVVMAFERKCKKNQGKRAGHRLVRANGKRPEWIINQDRRAI